MKKQKLSNKISLNKRTVSNLNNQEMDDLKGGSWSVISCLVRNCVPTEQTICAVCNEDDTLA